ncbi:MAG: hypothetical protein JXR95_14325 [Deltaproteobacteria bacterium]|nr:hypothetical protein [Deltaproteobacteria bacterium]
MLMENKIISIVFIVVGLILIGFGSYFLSQMAVKPDVKISTTIDEANKKVKKLDESFENLKKIWEEKGLKLSRDDLKGTKILPMRTNISLESGKSVDFHGLNISLSVVAKTHRMGNTDTHSVLLTLENKTKDYMAFRIFTEKSLSFVPCISGGSYFLHTFLIEPGKKVVRREGCSSTSKFTLKINDIQVVILPKAGYTNLIRLAAPVGIVPRLKRGHKNIRGPLPGCIIPDISRLEGEIKKAPLKWSNLMEFYAKHDCALEVAP